MAKTANKPSNAQVARTAKKPGDELAVVLDTNILMRLLVHALVSPSANVFGLLKQCRGTLWLAPDQEDEVFRNLHKIYDERMAAFEEYVARSRKSIDALIEAMTFLATIGVCSAEDVDAISRGKHLVQKLKNGNWTYESLENLAENELAHAKHQSDEASISETASFRVARHNPPCSDKKRSIGDCRIWELVISLLKDGRTVWLSTGDTDFCHNRSELHPFLQRETRQHADRFRFIFETTQASRPYLVLDALKERIGEVSAEVTAGIDSSAAMRPEVEGRMATVLTRARLLDALGVSGDASDSANLNGSSAFRASISEALRSPDFARLSHSPLVDFSRELARHEEYSNTAAQIAKAVASLGSEASIAEDLLRQQALGREFERYQAIMGGVSYDIARQIQRRMDIDRAIAEAAESAGLANHVGPVEPVNKKGKPGSGHG